MPASPGQGSHRSPCWPCRMSFLFLGDASWPGSPRAGLGSSSGPQQTHSRAGGAGGFRGPLSSRALRSGWRGAGRGPWFPRSHFPPHPRNCSPSGPRRTCRRWRERGRCHTGLVCVPGGRVLSTAALPATRYPQQFACRACCVEGSHRLQPARQVQGQDGSHTAARGTLSWRRNGVRAPGSRTTSPAGFSRPRDPRARS